MKLQHPFLNSMTNVSDTNTIIKSNEEVIRDVEKLYDRLSSKVVHPAYSDEQKQELMIALNGCVISYIMLKAENN